MSVTVNHSKSLLTVDPFRLDTENITLDNGVTTNVHILRHPGAAAIIPFLDPDTIVLIKQYRHAAGAYIWEIPAGTLNDPEESPLDCARRELIEETGYRGQRWQPLGRIMPSPGYCDEQLYLFLAFDLTPDDQSLEIDEVLQVHSLPFSRALEMIAAGEIYDAKTVAGLLLTQEHRRA